MECFNNISPIELSRPPISYATHKPYADLSCKCYLGPPKMLLCSLGPLRTGAGLSKSRWEELRHPRGHSRSVQAGSVRLHGFPTSSAPTEQAGALSRWWKPISRRGRMGSQEGGQQGATSPGQWGGGRAPASWGNHSQPAQSVLFTDSGPGDPTLLSGLGSPERPSIPQREAHAPPRSCSRLSYLLGGWSHRCCLGASCPPPRGPSLLWKRSLSSFSAAGDPS